MILVIAATTLQRSQRQNILRKSLLFILSLLTIDCATKKHLHDLYILHTHMIFLSIKTEIKIHRNRVLCLNN